MLLNDAAGLLPKHVVAVVLHVRDHLPVAAHVERGAVPAPARLVGAPQVDRVAFPARGVQTGVERRGLARLAAGLIDAGALRPVVLGAVHVVEAGVEAAANGDLPPVLGADVPLREGRRSQSGAGKRRVAVRTFPTMWVA